MSNDENHGQAHMTLTARKISGIFAIFFFFFILALQPILFHLTFAEGHYMLCSVEEISFKVEYSCLTSGHTYVAWCAWR